MEKSIIIVGAGIGGLSTGCYAQMNGYKTTILEMHSIPGGLCTAWKQKGYTFDISMHQFYGSKSGTLYQMWRELSVIKDQVFYYPDESMRIESGGKNLTICVDPHRLEEQLFALSPDDAKLTKELIRLFNGKSLLDIIPLKPREVLGLFDVLKMVVTILPLMGTIRKYGKLTIQEFSQKFNDPFLRNAVRFLIDSPGWPMPHSSMVNLSGRSKSETSVPLGGSQRVIFKIAEYCQKLGCDIHYKSRVKDMIIADNRAVGVRLEDGTEYRADIIVWAGDGHTVIFDILGGRYLNDEVRSMYNEWVPTSSLVQVLIGVARDFSKEPHRLVFELEKPINITGEERRWLYFRHRCFDPTMAPSGKSVVDIWYPTRYDYWEKLSRDRVRYEEEKKRIADITIAELDKRWPGFTAQIEVVDVPTPLTYVYYTGNWQGSLAGWYATPENMMKRTSLRSLPGLSGFYMVGHWIRPFAGVPFSALSGRQLIQLLCKQDGKQFVTSTS